MLLCKDQRHQSFFEIFCFLSHDFALLKLVRSLSTVISINDLCVNVLSMVLFSIVSWEVLWSSRCARDEAVNSF